MLARLQAAGLDEVKKRTRWSLPVSALLELASTAKSRWSLSNCGLCLADLCTFANGRWFGKLVIESLTNAGKRNTSKKEGCRVGSPGLSCYKQDL